MSSEQASGEASGSMPVEAVIGKYTIKAQLDTKTYRFTMRLNDVNYSGTSALELLNLRSLIELKLYFESAKEHINIKKVKESFEMRLPQTFGGKAELVMLRPEAPPENKEEYAQYACAVLEPLEFAVMTANSFKLSIDLKVFITWLCKKYDGVRDKARAISCYGDAHKVLKAALAPDGRLHMFPIVFRFLCEMGYRIADIKLAGFSYTNAKFMHDFLTEAVVEKADSDYNLQYVLAINFKKGDMRRYIINDISIIETLYDGTNLFILPTGFKTMALTIA